MNDGLVLPGRDGWLFLKEGSNRSFSYLTGAEPITPAVAARWKHTVHLRSQIFPGCLHLICPEKLAVFPQFAPGVNLDDTRLGLVLGQKASVFYPATILGEIDDVFGATYSKTDTHMNDLGAWRAVQLVLPEMGINVDFSAEWKTISILGDLGMKMIPQIRSDKLVLDNPMPVRVSDNGLQNRGRMILFHNEDALKRKLLIFGDSFSGINLARMFANFVSDTLFVHSLSADYQIVWKFKPDLILFEMAERFLRDLPSDGAMIEKLIVEKMLTERASRTKIAEWRAGADTATSAYIDWELIDFLTSGT